MNRDPGQVVGVVVGRESRNGRGRVGSLDPDLYLSIIIITKDTVSRLRGKGENLLARNSSSAKPRGDP
jgi:hypothetical protein